VVTDVFNQISESSRCHPTIVSFHQIDIKRFKRKEKEKEIFLLVLEKLNIDLMKENNSRLVSLFSPHLMKEKKSRVAVLLSTHLIQVHRLHFFMSNLIIVNSVRRNIVRATLLEVRVCSVSYSFKMTN
jgi:hypothetical protein